MTLLKKKQKSDATAHHTAAAPAALSGAEARAEAELQRNKLDKIAKASQSRTIANPGTGARQYERRQEQGQGHLQLLQEERP